MDKGKPSLIARNLKNSLYWPTQGYAVAHPRYRMTRQNQSTKSGRPKPDSRRQAVLATVIESYLISGEPVGSHTISDQFARATGWGSATIRNVMSELEEIGLLEQPHTSAGRIPTDQGYRYYVDNMLDSTQLSENDLSAIESISPGKGIRHGRIV